MLVHNRGYRLKNTALLVCSRAFTHFSQMRIKRTHMRNQPFFVRIIADHIRICDCFLNAYTWPFKIVHIQGNSSLRHTWGLSTSTQYGLVSLQHTWGLSTSRQYAVHSTAWLVCSILEVGPPVHRVENKEHQGEGHQEKPKVNDFIISRYFKSHV